MKALVSLFVVASLAACSSVKIDDIGKEGKQTNDKGKVVAEEEGKGNGDKFTPWESKDNSQGCNEAEKCGKASSGKIKFHHDFDKVEVRPEDAAKVRDCADLALKGGRAIVIDGHADRHGSAEYNQALSEKRAAQVRKMVVASGVKESRIKAIGSGATSLENYENTPEADAQNRRTVCENSTK